MLVVMLFGYAAIGTFATTSIFGKVRMYIIKSFIKYVWIQCEDVGSNKCGFSVKALDQISVLYLVSQTPPLLPHDCPPRC